MAMQAAGGGFEEFWTREDSPAPTLAWLGQAGFAFRFQNLRFLLDPYLSNNLEKKYRGTEKPHDRLMPVPVDPKRLRYLDFVLCTHRHTDHMDPETLLALSESNPDCRFLVPKSTADHVKAIGLPDNRVQTIDAFEENEIAEGCGIRAFPGAHETVDRDASGFYSFLGYGIDFGGKRIYHSGDTVPFDGLAGWVREFAPVLALLPVNGRGKGVAGNFTFPEAQTFCREARIPGLIPHHFGMFAFNTVDPASFELADESAQECPPRVMIPDLQSWWML